MTDPTEDRRRQAEAVLAALRDALDDAARVAILLDYRSRVRQDTLDEVLRRLRDA